MLLVPLVFSSAEIFIQNRDHWKSDHGISSDPFQIFPEHLARLHKGGMLPNDSDTKPRKLDTAKNACFSVAETSADVHFV